ncbi:MAG: hypothetical protein V1729_04995 [Candidatus Woesearchaeota archaeon]
MKLIHLSEALRMFKRARRVSKHGIRRYSGSEEEISRDIIRSCWNKKEKHFQVSSGHFTEFYCRDFGMCAEALVKLGYRKQVIQTLDYALSKFKKHGRITTSISPQGKCFDFPYYGADSLPFIVHALKVAKANQLNEQYDSFLTKEIKFYYEKVFDKKTHLIRQDKHFSSMKDYAKRSSSCYSNCMLFMLADDLDSLKLKNPFPKGRIQKEILIAFWNGDYFYDDTSFTKIVTGDANTYPFWCGVTNSEKVFDLCMKSIEKAGLTRPFPLKYSSSPEKVHKMHFLEAFSGGYERDSIWMHLGLCFLDVVKRFDRKRFDTYMKQYTTLIRKHGNFLEVYDANGLPFHTPFYFTDESMSWVSKYLALKD